MNTQLVKDHRVDVIKLWEHLPLRAPMSVYLLAASICNFKCHYCIHSQEMSDFCDEYSFTRMQNLRKSAPFLTLETLERFIQQAKQFPQKIKSIILASLGEPLLNPQIAEIVQALKVSGITERVDIVTNASHLTPELSDRLIAAGLDKLRVSIQGLDDESYYQSSQVRISFQNIIDNVTYFFHHKTKTTVYVKIMEEQLEGVRGLSDSGGGGGVKAFFDVFDGICDQISVEHLVPLVPILSEKQSEHYQFSINGREISTDPFICPRPFMSIQLLSNGDISSCCSPDYHVFGNIYDTPVTDIWESSQRATLLKKMLLSGKRSIPLCAECTFPKFEMRAEDNLDAYVEKLLPLY